MNISDILNGKIQLPSASREIKILLINPPHKDWAKILPLGIAYIAAVLEKNWLTVDVIDMSAEEMTLENLIAKLKGQESIDIVGITATTPQINSAWALAKKIKEFYPKTKIVLGGVHPSILPEESISKPYIDFVIRGEGEITFIDLIRALEGNGDLQEVLGLSFKQNGIVHNPARPLIDELDAIPYPARHLFKFLEAYSSPHLKMKNYANIITSRGCPESCIYCCNKSTFGSKFRARSPENVVNEIEFLLNRYGIKEIHIADDNFTYDLERAERICDLLLERNLNIVWSCGNGIRVDRINKPLLKKMKLSGCNRLSFGVESGSQEILKKMGKRITKDQVQNAIKLTKEAGIETIAFFMIGNYGENRNTIEESIRFAKSLDTDYAQFTITTPFPGTPLYKLLDRQGFILTKDWSKYGIYNHPVFRTNELTEELLIEMYNKAYKDFYFRLSYILKNIRNIRDLSDLRTMSVGGWEILKRSWRNRILKNTYTPK